MQGKPCKIDDCTRRVVAYGMCDPHYRRWRKGASMDIPERRVECSVGGCEGKHLARGYCERHYRIWRRRGLEGLAAKDEPRYIKCARQKCKNELTCGTELCSEHLDRLGSKTITRRCNVDGCIKASRTKGMCDAHYWRSRNGKELDAPLLYRDGAPCSHAGCDRRKSSFGYCELHARRIATGRDLDAPLYGHHESQICAHPPCDSTREPGFGAHCRMHHWRIKLGVDMDQPLRVMQPGRTCSVEGCSEPYLASGYCKRHYPTMTGKGAVYSRTRAARRRGGIPFSPDLWRMKSKYWGDRCWICGTDEAALEADHVKPLNRGGLDALCNLRPACRGCNARKSDRWPLEDSWLRVVRDRSRSCGVGTSL